MIYLYSSFHLLIKYDTTKNNNFPFELFMAFNSKRRKTDPTQEYERLHGCFAWEKDHFLHCNLEALRASFLPESMKQGLAAQLQERYRSIERLLA